MMQYEGIYIFGGIQKRYKDKPPETSDKMYILAILPSKKEKQVSSL